MKNWIFVWTLFFSSVAFIHGSHASPSELLKFKTPVYEDSEAQPDSTPVVTPAAPSLATAPMVGPAATPKRSAATARNQNGSSANSGDQHVIGVEGRVACLIPQNSDIRAVYGRSGFAVYELEGYVPLSCWRGCEPDWVFFGNLSFFEKTGHSTCQHHGTHMKNYAFTVGFKYFICHRDGYRPYVGFGMGVAHVNFHDHAPYVKSHIHEWGTALLVKSGVEIDLACNFYADLFIDYTANWYGEPSSKTCVNTRRINTGGGNFGLGMGYRF